MSKSGKSNEGIALAIIILFLTLLGAIFFLRPWMSPLVSNRIQVDEDFHTILLVVGPVFLIVQGFLACMVWRYPATKSGNPSPVAYLPRLTWLVFAVLLVLEGVLVSEDVWAWNSITAPPPPHGNWKIPVLEVYRWPYDYSVPGMSQDYLPQNIKEVAKVEATR